MQTSPAISEIGKDYDTSWWLGSLPAQERDAWLLLVRWQRVCDEASEAGGQPWDQLRQDWQVFRRSGACLGEWAAELRRIATLGCEWSDQTWHAWDELVDSQVRWWPSDIVDLSALEQFGVDASGSILRCAPGAPWRRRGAIDALGALDQLMNVLRDVEEDALTGRCWLPRDVMRFHGLELDEVLSAVEQGDPRLAAVCRDTWFGLSRTLCKKIDVIGEVPLTPAWRQLVRAFRDRHRGFAVALAASGFQPRTATPAYWAHRRARLAVETSAKG